MLRNATIEAAHVKIQKHDKRGTRLRVCLYNWTVNRLIVGLRTQLTSARSM